VVVRPVASGPRVAMSVLHGPRRGGRKDQRVLPVASSPGPTSEYGAAGSSTSEEGRGRPCSSSIGLQMAPCWRAASPTC
jgi:hypothetical protein